MIVDVLLAIAWLLLAFILGIISYAIWENRSGDEWWAQIAHRIYRHMDQRR